MTPGSAPKRTREECIDAAAMVLVRAAIRIAREEAEFAARLTEAVESVQQMWEHGAGEFPVSGDQLARAVRT